MLLTALLISGLALAQDCPGLESSLAAIDASSHCLTMPLRRAWRRAEQLEQTGCLGRALAARGLPHWAPPGGLAALPAPPAPLPDKQLRDSFGVPNLRESEDFALRWGSGGSGFDSGDVDELLEAFDGAWDYELDTMELPAPYGTETYKFNVYIGDTGSGAPSSYGNSGYYYVDSQGYPYIVVAASALQDMDWGTTTAVHEFFHAVQDATGNYNGEEGSWLWEATASWVEGEIYPSNPYYASFLMGFAFLPHKPLDFYDYPDSGALQEFHQYGAFIFPRYISEIAADWTLVRDVWLLGDPWGDPLQVFDELLVEQGQDLDTVWTEFVAHNATWDYQDGDIYEWYLDWYSGYYDDQSVADTLYGAGSAEWKQPQELLPERYGANYIALRSPDSGTLQLEFEGEPAGSWGSDASWSVTLVQGDSDPSYHPVDMADGSGSASIPGVGGEAVIWLVVGAWSAERRSGETFGYRYRLWVGDDGPGETGDTGGGGTPERPGGEGVCGCHAAGVAGLVPMLFLLPLALRRRRRYTSRASPRSL